MTAPTVSARTGFPILPLLILSGAIFVSVTSEFLPTGLLPDMAKDLEVSESQVGLLVTVFAGTVVLTAAPLAIFTRNLSRKWLMVGLLGVFALSNVAAGLAPTYEVLVAARVFGGLAHGLFWAVTGPYASHLVRKDQLARAISVTNGGGTLAFIIGVPIGTAIGHALEWRSAFLVMAGVVAVFTVLTIVFLPPVKHLEDLATGEIRLPARKDRSLRGVIVVCVIVILVMTGHNAFYTYIAPWLIEVADFSADAVPGALFAYGVAGAVGLLLAGLFGDRFPRGSIIVFIVGVMLSVLLLMGVSNVPWLVVVGLFLWSASFGGLPSMVHARNLHVASHNIRDFASALVTTSFNLAIGGGAFIGGLLLDGFGLTILPWGLIAFVAAGLAFVLVTDGLAARRER